MNAEKELRKLYSISLVKLIRHEEYNIGFESVHHISRWENDQEMV